MHSNPTDKYKKNNDNLSNVNRLPLLNCGSPAQAIESLAIILALSPNSLLERMTAIDITGLSTDDIRNKLADEFLRESELPDFSVVWFHGTRLLRDHTVMTDGLLPTHMIKDRLLKFLKNLNGGLERCGENPFSTSATSKPSIEGPFGNLFRDGVIAPKGFIGNYICRPELVDDIAGGLLGANYRELTNRFAQYSIPSVIHFLGNPNENVLKEALRYVYETLLEGANSVESASRCIAFFDGGGEPVLPKMLLKIEEVSICCGSGYEI